MMHNGIRYNCRVFCLNRKIVLIRPKVHLADDGNYREPRFFSAWKRLADMESHHLSPLLVKASGGQREVPFGVAVIRTTEATLASECCEELWTLL
ncbi:NADSYN1, partial [Symbiodinium microadriaticum]